MSADRHVISINAETGEVDSNGLPIVTNQELLDSGIIHLNYALENLMDVKSEIGNELANKVYKAIRIYEKYQEKKLKEQGIE